MKRKLKMFFNKKIRRKRQQARLRGRWGPQIRKDNVTQQEGRTGE
jgi:hypothetical protein